MLQHRHEARRYTRANLAILPSRPPTARSLAGLLPIRQPDMDRELGDSGAAFANVARLLELRSELLYRHLRGDALDTRETHLLRLLTALARRFMRPPDGFSGETQAALDEIRRIRTQRNAGR
jgi:hypothetical protein